MDYSSHRLVKDAEIDALKEKYGEKFTRFQAEIIKFLEKMPLDDWIPFTQSMNRQNIPIAIKIICHYIDQNATIYDFVEFNSTFTHIRRKILTTNKSIRYEITAKK